MKGLQAHAHLLCSFEEVILELSVELTFSLLSVVHGLIRRSYRIEIAFSVIISEDGTNTGDQQELVQVGPCSLDIEFLGLRETFLAQIFHHGRSDEKSTVKSLRLRLGHDDCHSYLRALIVIAPLLSLRLVGCHQFIELRELFFSEVLEAYDDVVHFIGHF